MLIDVQDPVRNLVLNLAFIAVVLMALAAVVPWGTLGAERIGRLATWLALPTLAAAIVYEAAMPSRYDIRVDLLLLVPAYGLVLLATLVRLLVRWRARRRRKAGRAT